MARSKAARSKPAGRKPARNRPARSRNKPARRKPTIRAIVSLDLGRTRSGFAYAFVSDRRVVSAGGWPAEPAPYPKTASQILYDGHRHALAWGFPAAQTRALLEGKGKAVLVDGFLDALGDSGRPAIVAGGKRFSTLDATADLLRFLAEAAWTKVSQATAGELARDEVAWCLPVPAEWGDGPRRLLVQAAKKAGLVGRGAADARRLTLVDAPLAAVIHGQEAEGRPLERGQRLVVVDAGGRRVEVTAYVVEPRGLRHLRRIKGGGAPGSEEVDRLFVERCLGGRLGGDTLAAYRAEEPLDFLAMMDDWERLKCRFRSDTSHGETFLPFRPRLLRLLAGRFPDVLARLEKERSDDGLYLDPGEVEALFRPVLDRLAEEVRTALDKAGSCDVVYVFGGLASSPLVAERLRRALGRGRRLVVPPVPAAAVMEGAVSFVLDPRTVRPRRSRVSVGCAADVPHDAARDPESRRLRYHDLGTDYSRARFHPLLRAGEELRVGDRRTWAFSPMTRVQGEMVFDFFSAAGEPRWVDDDGTTALGRLVVALPNPADVDRRVELVLTVGEKEIRAEAVDLASGRKGRLSLPLPVTLGPWPESGS